MPSTKHTTDIHPATPPSSPHPLNTTGIPTQRHIRSTQNKTAHLRALALLDHSATALRDAAGHSAPHLRYEAARLAATRAAAALLTVTFSPALGHQDLWHLISTTTPALADHALAFIADAPEPLHWPEADALLARAETFRTDVQRLLDGSSAVEPGGAL